MENKETQSTVEEKSKRKYISQSDIPRVSLEEALRIPYAIYENYGENATPPLKVAQALELAPKSSHFRTIAGAAVAYGVTIGGPNAAQIEISALGFRIVKPLKENDDLIAKREAFLTPLIISNFLRQYDNAPFPRQDIAINVLDEMGVPKSRVQEVFDLIIQGAESLGFFTEIKGKRYVTVTSFGAKKTSETTDITQQETKISKKDIAVKNDTTTENITKESNTHTTKKPERIKRVFVTHGKNREFIGPIKKLLSFGEFDPVVATEKESVSIPVPEKVMDNMRDCGAAIIHVDSEHVIEKDDGNKYYIINPNVLIEIGAAMALYGRRFILLVREGITLPSNLQGLYEVRYKGESLDGEATIRLLEAIMDIKNNPLP